MESALSATIVSFFTATRSAFCLIRYVVEQTRLLKTKIRLMPYNTYVCDVWLIQMHFDNFYKKTSVGLIWSTSTQLRQDLLWVLRRSQSASSSAGQSDDVFSEWRKCRNEEFVRWDSSRFDFGLFPWESRADCLGRQRHQTHHIVGLAGYFGVSHMVAMWTTEGLDGYMYIFYPIDTFPMSVCNIHLEY